MVVALDMAECDVILDLLVDCPYELTELPRRPSTTALFWRKPEGISKPSAPDDIRRRILL